MDEEIWDEHRWEEFLREADKRTELYHQLFEAYLRNNPPPAESASDDEREEYWETLHEHVAEQMGWHRPDDEDAPDWLADAEPDDDDDEGESWKSGLVDDFPAEQDFEDLPIYRKAYGYGSAVYEWVDSLPEDERESAIVELCANALQIAAKIASGHGFGYELDTLGGNIAQCKRALAAANRSLDALRNLRRAGRISLEGYRSLYEHGFEVRNEIGLYVQDLRERFERGIE